MTELHFPTHSDGLLQGLDQLLVLAPQKSFRAGAVHGLLPGQLHADLDLLGTGLEAGSLGQRRETWRRESPLRLCLGLLPDHVSRHNSRTRRDAITELMAAAKLEGHAGVLVLVDEPSDALAAAAGIASTCPLFDARAKAEGPKTLRIIAATESGQWLPMNEAAMRALAIVRDTARLVDLPAEDLTPDAFSLEVSHTVQSIAGCQLQAIVGPELLAAGLRALHAVGRAATTAPRLLILDTGPRGSAEPLALVGKGITFDTGGLHIKARGPMDTMKCDMGGAAAVLGAFRILAAESTNRRIFALLALAENAVDANAFRPGDILRTHAGRTVEINNTDAEGRLVLADGLSYAARVLGARILIDAATLTGAQMIATGIRHGAVVSNDARLEELAVLAGRETGELVFPLPFAPEFYQREFRSKVADMKNSVGNRSNAQASCAAQFLWRQIDDLDLPWLHLDLAGPAFRDERGTGYGALLLARIATLLP